MPSNNFEREEKRGSDEIGGTVEYLKYLFFADFSVEGMQAAHAMVNMRNHPPTAAKTVRVVTVWVVFRFLRLASA